MNCINDHCENIAYFNYKCKKIPLYCWLHKLINMIEIRSK